MKCLKEEMNNIITIFYVKSNSNYNLDMYHYTRVFYLFIIKREYSSRKGEKRKERYLNDPRWKKKKVRFEQSKFIRIEPAQPVITKRIQLQFQPEKSILILEFLITRHYIFLNIEILKVTHNSIDFSILRISN